MGDTGKDKKLLEDCLKYKQFADLGLVMYQIMYDNCIKRVNKKR